MIGEKLFLLYAFPCARIRLVRRQIDEDRYFQLTAALQTERPRRRLLKFCFPHAFKALRELARANSRLDPWSLKNVQALWRENHQKDGGICAVSLIAVSDKVPLSNPYSYDLQPGDRVYIHMRCIIEKVD